MRNKLGPLGGQSMNRSWNETYTLFSSKVFLRSQGAVALPVPVTISTKQKRLTLSGYFCTCWMHWPTWHFFIKMLWTAYAKDSSKAINILCICILFQHDHFSIKFHFSLHPHPPLLGTILKATQIKQIKITPKLGSHQCPLLPFWFILYPEIFIFL